MSQTSTKKVNRKLAPFQGPEQSFEEKLAQQSFKSPLRKMRREAGLTLQQLATKSGISASYLSRIEAKARRMNEEVINRLCIVLGCQPGQLLSSAKDFAQYEHKPSAAMCDFPVYKLQAGSGDNMILDINAKEATIFRPAELTAEASAFAVKICNSANDPKFRIGDMIFIHPSHSLKEGMAVFAIDTNNNCTIGSIVSNTPDSIMIKSFGVSGKQHIFKKSELHGLYAIYMTIEAKCC